VRGRRLLVAVANPTERFHSIARTVGTTSSRPHWSGFFLSALLFLQQFEDAWGLGPPALELAREFGSSYHRVVWALLFLALGQQQAQNRPQRGRPPDDRLALSPYPIRFNLETSIFSRVPFSGNQLERTFTRAGDHQGMAVRPPPRCALLARIASLRRVASAGSSPFQLCVSLCCRRLDLRYDSRIEAG